MREAGLRADALNGVLWAAWDLALPTAGRAAQPDRGRQRQPGVPGVVQRGIGTNPTEWRDEVQRIA